MTELRSAMRSVQYDVIGVGEENARKRLRIADKVDRTLAVRRQGFRDS